MSAPISSQNFEMWLQSRLTAHGYPVGLIDGDIGPVTIRALMAFQFAKGLKQTGTSDAATVAALRGSSSAVPPDIKAKLPDRDAPPQEEVQPLRRIWPRQSEVRAFYGEVGQNQTAIEIPFDMFLAWDKSTRIRKMTLHKLVADSARLVLQDVAAKYSADERHALGIDLFGGSLNVRKMRGGSNFSMHSWGIAIDFDPERNQLHTKAPQARLSHADALPFWASWEKAGWVSLGRAKNYDWMHVQAARL